MYRFYCMSYNVPYVPISTQSSVVLLCSTDCVGPHRAFASTPSSITDQSINHTLLFTIFIPWLFLQAELYTGGGAEYYVRSWDSKDYLLCLNTYSLCLTFLFSIILILLLLQNKRPLLETKIAQAQNKKRGMWSLGSQRISAADHKRGVTSSAPAVPVAASVYGSAGRGGAQESATGRSSSKANQGRGSNLLESAMTGLELVG
jgi:hypothetical protein